MSSTTPEPLDAGLIRSALSPKAMAALRQLTVLRETDSTNTEILRLPGDRQHAHAVLADHQTGGRGRRQRSWHSPPGGNVYLSLGWWFRNNEWPLSTLPLVIAVAVCKALARAGLQGHGIKWPNDILADGKKLAGILVELQSAGRGPALAVVGVGLNVRMPRMDGVSPDRAIDRPWTDLDSAMNSCKAGTDRNRLVAWLLEELLSAVETFESEGFPAFSESWRELDLLKGKSVRLDRDDRQIFGRVKGVDDDGGLLLESDTAGLQVFHSGEVSVHGVERSETPL